MVPPSMVDEPAALLGKEMAATFFPEKTKEKGGEGRHPHRSKSFSGEFLCVAYRSR